MALRKPYHHGNLKESLLDSSISLLREQGIEALTLRQIATRAGVSHTAAYRHFRDKDQIKLALAESISKRIADRIAYHSLKGLLPQECLLLGSLAALRYFLENPADFRLLSGIKAPSSPAANAPLERLQSLLAPCGFSATQPPPAALLIWCHLHGIADLSLRGQPGLQSRKQTLELASSSLSALFRSWQ